MSKKNIVLIGMPTAGKSTVGVILAKVFGYQFLDTDLLIQHQEEKVLCDIIQEKGVKKFLEIEENVVMRLSCKKTVIATGGSVVYSQMAMEHLKKSGVFIYLSLPLSEIQNRLKNMIRRGVVSLKENETLLELYDERTPLYEQYADISIDCAGKSVEQVVNTICHQIAKWNQ